jgi:hypothetical protein
MSSGPKCERRPADVRSLGRQSHAFSRLKGSSDPASLPGRTAPEPPLACVDVHAGSLLSYGWGESRNAGRFPTPTRMRPRCCICRWPRQFISPPPCREGAKGLARPRGGSGMNNKPVKGDVIEVYQERRERTFPRWTWTKARIVDVSADGAILAQALKGTFDYSHDHIILEPEHRGTTWR